jgi:hypothetical protein
LSRKGTASLLVAAVIAITVAQEEPTVVRLRDAVGDTIDRVERDSFRLFPNTVGFRYGVVLGLPGSQFVARVAQADGDTLVPVYYRILPGQLERIRYLIDNRGYVEDQLQSDTGSVRTLADFWQSIEERPLASASGRPPEPPATAKPRSRLVTAEHRLDNAIHGAACSSIAGGCIGTQTSYYVIEPGHYEEGCVGPIYIPPVLGVNISLLLASSIGATAVGATVGYALGVDEDRRPLPAITASEGTNHRNSFAAASVLPAMAVGFLVGAVAHGTLFGRENSYTLGNDPHGLSVIPAVLAGVCVSVDIVALCYQVGRSIDRDEAEQAERRNRSLGH